MKPAEHYRRARFLVDLEEADLANTRKIERIGDRWMRLAHMHILLGELAHLIGDEQTFLSSNRRTRIVLTLPSEDDADLAAAMTAISGCAAGIQEAGLASGYSAVMEAFRNPTVWDSDDDMRRFAATDGPGEQ